MCTNKEIESLNDSLKSCVLCSFCDKINVCNDDDEDKTISMRWVEIYKYSK